MKTITYRGNQCEVPEWVNFVAMDADGDIFGYEHEPYTGDGDWFCSGGRVKHLRDTCIFWEESLEKV